MSAAIRGLIIYSNLAIYATDAESKLYCMYDNYSTFANILVFAGQPSVASLGAITARISPVACVTLSITFGLITNHWWHVIYATDDGGAGAQPAPHRQGHPDGHQGHLCAMSAVNACRGDPSLSSAQLRG